MHACASVCVLCEIHLNHASKYNLKHPCVNVCSPRLSFIPKRCSASSIQSHLNRDVCFNKARQQTCIWSKKNHILRKRKYLFFFLIKYKILLYKDKIARITKRKTQSVQEFVSYNENIFSGEFDAQRMELRIKSDAVICFLCIFSTRNLSTGKTKEYLNLYSWWQHLLTKQKVSSSSAVTAPVIPAFLYCFIHLTLSPKLWPTGNLGVLVIRQYFWI